MPHSNTDPSNVSAVPRKRNLRAKPYTWKEPDGSEKYGIAILCGNQLFRFLTPEQAISLANKLADAVEAHTERRSSNAPEA